MTCTSRGGLNRQPACTPRSSTRADQLEIVVSKLTPDLVVKNLTKKTTIPAKQDLSEREKTMLKAGGLLAYTAQGH